MISAKPKLEAEALAAKIVQDIIEIVPKGLPESTLREHIREMNSTKTGVRDETIDEIEEVILATLRRHENANYTISRKSLNGFVYGEKNVLMNLSGKLDRLEILDLANENLAKKITKLEAELEGKTPDVLVDVENYFEKLNLENHRGIVKNVLEHFISELRELGYNIDTLKGKTNVL